jgi:hypothetical protein
LEQQRQQQQLSITKDEPCAFFVLYDHFVESIKNVEVLVEREGIFNIGITTMQ